MRTRILDQTYPRAGPVISATVMYKLRGVSRSRSVNVASAVLFGGGVLAMVAHQVLGDETGLWPVVSSFGFGAPIVGTASLAWLGNRYSEPIYVTFAGIAAIIMSVVSILLFPLSVPAGLLVWASIPALKDVEHKEVAMALGASVLMILTFMIPIVIVGAAAESGVEAVLSSARPEHGSLAAESGPRAAIAAVAVVLILVRTHLRSQS